MKTCPNCQLAVDDEIMVCPNCNIAFSDEVNEPTATIKTEKRSDTEKTAKSRQEKRQSKQSFPSKFAHYFRYLYLHVRNPFPKKGYPETKKDGYGLISLVLMAIFNTLTLTSLVDYLIDNYEWLSNISILPNLSFTFTPWLFALQSLFFFIVSFWLLTAIIQFVNNKVFKLGYSNKHWLTQYFGMNSLALVLAFVSFILSIFAPLTFLVINAFLLLIQFVIFMITTTIHILRVENKSRISDFYWTIIILAIYFMIEMILITLIY